MKVVVHWSGGKECCLALHKVVEQGHEVAYLLSYVYKKPYVFHSFKLMELQSKTLGVPQLKVKIKKSYEDILAALGRLNREEGVEAFVTGDIVGAGCAQIHQTYYDAMCEQLGMKLIMPNENPSKDTYHVLKEEIAAGIQDIDVCSEDGRGFHTMVLDAPLFKERLEIGKFKKKKYKEKAKNWKRNWLYMDIKDAFLRPKK